MSGDVEGRGLPRQPSGAGLGLRPPLLGITRLVPAAVSIDEPSQSLSTAWGQAVSARPRVAQTPDPLRLTGDNFRSGCVAAMPTG